MDKFNFVNDNGLVKIEKEDYDNSDKGSKNKEIPILGWFLASQVGTWINYLRGLDCIYNIREQDLINEEHLTLYNDDKKEMIGWVSKKYKNEILEAMFDYLKNNGGNINNLKKDDNPRYLATQSGKGKSTKNRNQSQDDRQLSLF